MKNLNEKQFKSSTRNLTAFGKKDFLNFAELEAANKNSVLLEDFADENHVDDISNAIHYEETEDSASDFVLENKSQTYFFPAVPERTSNQLFVLEGKNDFLFIGVFFLLVAFFLIGGFFFNIN